MPTDQQFLDEIERKLATHAPSLAAEYRAAVAQVQPVLSDANLRVRVTDIATVSGRSFSLDWVAVDVTYLP